MKNVILRMASMCLSFAVTFLITRIVVLKLGDEAYGFFQLSNDFVNYAAVISTALNSMAVRFITVCYCEKNRTALNKYYNSLLYGNLLLAFFLSIPALFFLLFIDKIINIPSELLSDIRLLFLLMFVNFLISIAGSVFGAATYVTNHVELDTFRTMESNIFRLFIVLFMYFALEPKIWFLAVSTTAGTLYICFRNIKYTKRLIPEAEVFQRSYFDFSYVKILVRSGLWNSFTSIGSILLSGLDLFIANRFVSDSAMGLLAVAKTIPKYIIQSASGLAAVFTPGIMIEYAREDKQQFVRKIMAGIKTMSVFSISVEAVIISLGKRIFDIWVPGQDSDTLYILCIVSMAGYIVLMPLESLWTVFTAADKVKISAVYLTCEAVAVCAVVFTMLRTVQTDMAKMLVIAGVSAVFELIRGFTFLPAVSARIIGVPYKTFYIPVFRNLIAFIAASATGITINHAVRYSGVLILAGLGAVIGLISAGICFLLVYDQAERREFTERIIQKIFK